MNKNNSQDKKSNRLINEKSPYLLQHAYNPVNWYPWGDEAFQKAKEENKPIFLSIGYSTCHWCHVMEKESFEDQEVAAKLNDSFISIKVDREERPDIDHAYMTACQVLTGSGGWPLTIIMTPDREPFFATTYVPKESSSGRAGMLNLIPRIKQLWNDEQSRVDNIAKQTAEFLKQTEIINSGESLKEELLEDAFNYFDRIYDPNNGGFGKAPKFPAPHNLIFLLRYWHRYSNEQALVMVETTLKKMRLGGIYDHLGYGFHRYSTDQNWLLPHFEKMLYDQAMMAMAYSEAYQITEKKEYIDTAQEILDYILRDLRAPSGGFYSAVDADSEGQEGKFYTWSMDEIEKTLSQEEADLCRKVFNLKDEGNFLDEATGKLTGKNILFLSKPLNELADILGINYVNLKTRISEAKKRLFLYREKRIHPHKDDKILTDWNGLSIAALAKFFQITNKKRYLEEAEKSTEFILSELMSAEGFLLHRYRQGQAVIPAFLNDYAFLVWGLIELYEATFKPNYLKKALGLTETCLKYFWDSSNGGLFFSADNSERLIIRHKEIYDGALPSGNSVFMFNLLRLSRLTGNTDLEKYSNQIGKAFSKQVNQDPHVYAFLLTALDFSLGPSKEIVITGQEEAADTKKIIKIIRKQYLPRKVILFRPGQEKIPAISKLVPFTKEMSPINNKATVYICHNYRCHQPITDIKKIIEVLSKE